MRNTDTDKQTSNLHRAVNWWNSLSEAQRVLHRKKVNSNLTHLSNEELIHVWRSAVGLPYLHSNEYQELFDYLGNELGCIPLVSQMQEIVAICIRIKLKTDAN